MMAKEIQKIMIEQDIKKCELAAKLNTTSSNFDTYNSLTPNWYYKVLR